MSEYQRSYSREDPRLTRHNSSVVSPKDSAATKVPQDPRTRTSSSSSWDSNLNQYNSQQHLQTSYQHLQPSNMYNNGNQYAGQYYGYENYNNYNPYQYGQPGQQQQYMSGSVQPGPPGEDYPQGGWAPVNASNYGQQSTTSNTADYNQSNSLDKNYKDEGVAEELSKQKANLIKERDTYEERVDSLKKKLDLLVKQKEDLSSKRTPDRETLHIIKENTKLQLEIQSKIKDATNVIEILSGLIGDQKKKEEEEANNVICKPDDLKISEKINYKHYDPEIHWCRMCDVFPQSAKELLVHLHSKGHQDTVQEEIPWHKLPPEPKFPVHEGAPVRRLPIKGLQFFVAATAWYCRLCDTWIGDLHCASQHLMSITHSQNYSNFVEQNPHWEIEWLKDREKALERIKKNKDSDSDDRKKKRRKDKYSPTALLAKDKKKKKKKRRRKHSSDSSSSSSSSSSSDDDDKDDKSKSIRVAMRNKIKLLEGDGKWDILGKLVEERKRQESINKSPNKEEDKLMSQWMTISEPPDKDKHLLDSLKEKLKQKQEVEKAKLAAEYEAARKEREREDYERKQKEKEKLELEQEELKHREKMSMKMKDQVRFKGKEYKENYRRHRSPSHSPDRRHRRSRSPSAEKKPRSTGRSFDNSPHMRYNKEKVDDRRDKERNDRDRSREREKKAPVPYKKLPFIGRMPLFKNQKGKGGKPMEERKEQREIQKEDYDIPRKTRFQPGNLARAFIPEPEVVCFPKLSTYPPIPPPPPALTAVVPEPPKISLPKPPPPPKIESEEKAKEKEPEKEKEVIESTKEVIQQETVASNQDEYSMLYEDSSNAMMYSYGNMDYNMMYQTPQSFNFMQAPTSSDPDVPLSHTMPLQPPPLPPDDPNDDLAMLGLSSDDMAVQQMQ